MVGGRRNFRYFGRALLDPAGFWLTVLLGPKEPCRVAGSGTSCFRLYRLALTARITRAQNTLRAAGKSITMSHHQWGGNMLVTTGTWFAA
jgi:hypothetical protein